MIKYLVKFVSKESYANDLLNGKLFMHCAKYYHELEKKYGPGQGDVREGLLFPNAAIYRNIHYPIYCLYMIKDKDIIDGLVTIDKRVLKDFNCQHGFMVFIPFDSLDDILENADTDGYAMDGSEVWYGVPSPEESMMIINDERALNLIVKNPSFRYQREYRFIVFKNIYQDDSSIPEERTFTVHLAKPLTGLAKKIPISSLKETETGYLLDLSLL